MYYQNTRQYSALLSATLVIPFVASQSVFSIVSGQYVSRTKRYGEVIRSGYALWTLGTGVGNVFQPTLIASQAHSKKADRAVVISVRKFLRSLGRRAGLALFSAVFPNVLSDNHNNISTSLPSDTVRSILASILAVPSLVGIYAKSFEGSKGSKGFV
jgi:hypothetical protein